MSADGPGSERIPRKRIPAKQELDVVQYLGRNLSIPFSPAIAKRLMLCGAGNDVRALPPHVRELARAFIRFSEGEELTSFLTNSADTAKPKGGHD